jgi:hypothetical protein
MYFTLGFPFMKLLITRVPKKKETKDNGRFADHWDLLVRVFVFPAYTAQCTVYKLDSKFSLVLVVSIPSWLV